MIRVLIADDHTIVREGLRHLLATAGDIVVVGGGIIPEDDVPKLKRAGVKAVFGPGTPLSVIVSFFEKADKGV